MATTRTKPPYQEAKARAAANRKKIEEVVSNQGVLGETKRRAAKKTR